MNANLHKWSPPQAAPLRPRCKHPRLRNTKCAYLFLLFTQQADFGFLQCLCTAGLQIYGCCHFASHYVASSVKVYVTRVTALRSIILPGRRNGETCQSY